MNYPLICKNIFQFVKLEKNWLTTLVVGTNIRFAPIQILCSRLSKLDEEGCEMNNESILDLLFISWFISSITVLYFWVLLRENLRHTFERGVPCKESHMTSHTRSAVV
jgi:hypothetical protein